MSGKLHYKWEVKEGRGLSAELMTQHMQAGHLLTLFRSRKDRFGRKDGQDHISKPNSNHWTGSTFESLYQWTGKA